MNYIDWFQLETLQNEAQDKLKQQEKLGVDFQSTQWLILFIFLNKIILNSLSFFKFENYRSSLSDLEFVEN